MEEEKNELRTMTIVIGGQALYKPLVVLATEKGLEREKSAKPSDLSMSYTLNRKYKSKLLSHFSVDRCNNTHALQ